MPAIALNGRFSGTPQPTGTQTASHQLFDAIVRAPRDLELVVFADPGFWNISEWAGAEGVRLISVPFRKWSRRRAQQWEQIEFPRLARRYGCRVAHHPMTTCPAWQNGLKNVVTLHDLNFYRHPEWYSLAFRLVYSLCAVPGLRRAARVVAVSDYVRRQAEEVLKIRPGRLARVYNGVKPICPGGRPPAGRYLLCVGSLQPHKNLARMIRAFQSVRAEAPDLELRVVGRPQPRFAKDPDLPGLLGSPGVRLLGYLSEADLASEYSQALAFCYPSLEEGFGLPVLEAMGLETPVLTSDLSCLPEVAGPSAVLVDPMSEDSIAGGLRRILGWTASQRRETVEAGKRWAAGFSWGRAADEYLGIYRQLLP